MSILPRQKHFLAHSQPYSIRSQWPSRVQGAPSSSQDSQQWLLSSSPQPGVSVHQCTKGMYRGECAEEQEREKQGKLHRKSEKVLTCLKVCILSQMTYSHSRASRGYCEALYFASWWSWIAAFVSLATCPVPVPALRLLYPPCSWLLFTRLACGVV